MTHPPAVRAWVIAGMVGLAAGLAQPANANTVNVLAPDGPSGIATDESTNVDGTWVCSLTCYGFVDADTLFDGFEGDEFTDTTDPFVADPFDVQGAAHQIAGLDVFAGGLLDGEPTTEILASSLGCNSDGSSCTFDSGVFQWIIAQINGWTAVFEMTAANTTITWTGQHGLSHIVGVGVIPLPTTLPLFLTGLLGLGFLARRRRQMAEA